MSISPFGAVTVNECESAAGSVNLVQNIPDDFTIRPQLTTGYQDSDDLLLRKLACDDAHSTDTLWQSSCLRVPGGCMCP